MGGTGPTSSLGLCPFIRFYHVNHTCVSLQAAGPSRKLSCALACLWQDEPSWVLGCSLVFITGLYFL